MAEAVATVATVHGSRYLQQVCKHFAHKIEVSYDQHHGECIFAMGTAVLDADNAGLTIVARAENDADLERTKTVIESHLVRFAFREELSPLGWSAEATR